MPQATRADAAGGMMGGNGMMGAMMMGRRGEMAGMVMGQEGGKAAPPVDSPALARKIVYDAQIDLITDDVDPVIRAFGKNESKAR
jgi:hypothetical protein